jgi:hypothetical protein
MYYIELPNGSVLGYSLKAGATTIHEIWLGRDKRAPRLPRLGVYEALQKRNQGHDVHLFVRDPLERIVSCYKYFTTVHNGFVRDVKEGGPEHLKMFLGNDEWKNISFSDWWSIAQQYENGHWDSQTFAHSYNEEFVPNVLYPLEAMSLGTDIHANKTERRPASEYMDEGLKAELLERYADDVALYARAKEEWDGRAPTVLRGP